jgi:Flp pilus assembly pilin Flp
MKSERVLSRRDSLLARCRALSCALSRPFRGSSSGASLVEYLIITGFVALFAIGAFSRFGTVVHKGLRAEASRIEGKGLPSTGDLLGSLGDSPPPFCEIGSTSRFCVRGSGFCFAKGTPVAAEGGDRPIESILVGDRVWARDAESGRVALRPVTTKFVTPGMPTIDLELFAGSHSELVTVTPGHRFWVEGRGWTPAEDLEASPLASLQDSLWAIPLSGVPPPQEGRLGTTLLTTGPSGSLWATPLSSRSTTTTVYNLEVDGFHTYFVGHLHALVHNQNTQPNPNNCPGGTGGTGGTSGQGTGGSAGNGGTAPKADPLVPCYTGPSTAIPQNSFPPNITKKIQDIANTRKGLSGNDKGKQSELAGDAAAEGYTDNNFPAPAWQCASNSGSRVFDRTCVNPGTGAVVIVEAKGGNSSLGTRLGEDGVTPVKQGTPEYVDAVLADLKISDPVLYGKIKAARDSGDLRYVRVNQKFDDKGNPKPAQVREFELDPNQRATNCKK